MPASGGSSHWFEEEFGFVERAAGSFQQVRNAFILQEAADGEVQLTSKANGRTFAVGNFETPSVFQLRERLHEARMVRGKSEMQGGLVFSNVVGSIGPMHQDPANADAVIQVASQFNCLEMVGPGVRPEDGITQYAHDHTQGPACALMCPAATVYRNYFWGGRGQRGGSAYQLDTMADVAKLLDNRKNKYWDMRNGYLLPSSTGSMRMVAERLKSESVELPANYLLRVPGSGPAQDVPHQQTGEHAFKNTQTQGQGHALAQLSPEPDAQKYTHESEHTHELEFAQHPSKHRNTRSSARASVPLVERATESADMGTQDRGGSRTSLEEAMIGSVRVGVHWSTEVKFRGKQSASPSTPEDQAASRQHVCQVFSSAVPCAYAKSTSSQDWEPFACTVLNATYEAVLLVAAIRAHQKGQRQKVLLTCVGGGAFGNRSMWILKAMERAIRIHAHEPLDVFLVHYRTLPKSEFAGLEASFGPASCAKRRA